MLPVLRFAPCTLRRDLWIIGSTPAQSNGECADYSSGDNSRAWAEVLYQQRIECRGKLRNDLCSILGREAFAAAMIGRCQSCQLTPSVDESQTTLRDMVAQTGLAF